MSQANSMPFIARLLREGTQTAQNISAQFTASGHAGNQTREATYLQVWRILERMAQRGVVMAVHVRPRTYTLASPSALDTFTYGYRDMRGQKRPDLQHVDGAANAARRKENRPALPLAAGCAVGDRVTSKGQPFVCVGAKYVETKRNKQRMAVSVWRSRCAHAGCNTDFDQVFPQRFPFRVAAAPLRTCEKHRRRPTMDLMLQVQNEELVMFDKFKAFLDIYRFFA